MPLNLIRRLVKGLPLDAEDHDQNLDVLEQAIETIELTPGPAGQAVELQATATHVQWRYVDEEVWTDLIPLAEITGTDGREVQLRATTTHIQWRYESDENWTDLIPLAEITGTTAATFTRTTASLAPDASEDFTVAAGNAFQLLSIQASRPAWIRVYGTSAARAADTRTQPGGNVPAAGSEFYAEAATTETPQTIRFSPVPLVQGTNGAAFVRVVNRDAVARAIALTFNVLTLQE